MNPMKAFKLPNTNSQPNLKVDKFLVGDMNGGKTEILTKSKSSNLFKQSVMLYP